MKVLWSCPWATVTWKRAYGIRYALVYPKKHTKVTYLFSTAASHVQSPQLYVLIHHHASVVQGDCFTITGPKALRRHAEETNVCAEKERKLSGKTARPSRFSLPKNHCSYIYIYIGNQSTIPSSLATTSSGLPPTATFLSSATAATFKAFYPCHPALNHRSFPPFFTLAQQLDLEKPTGSEEIRTPHYGCTTHWLKICLFKKKMASELLTFIYLLGVFSKHFFTS